jgi:hypothetical protein
MAEQTHGQIGVVPAGQFEVIANAAGSAIVPVHKSVIGIRTMFVVKEAKIHTSKVMLKRNNFQWQKLRFYNKIKDMIQLTVKQKERRRVAKLGGRLLPDGKTWVIPDEITDINGFAPWLPYEEGFIVQRPYFVVRGKYPCWKCKQEIAAVKLGAKFYQESYFEDADIPQWKRAEGPILFIDIKYMDETISRSMRENYPFFKLIDSKELEGEEWCNCCTHCGTAQEENGDWQFGCKNPFSPYDIAGAREIRVIYFKLGFDYYINAGWETGTLLPEIIR